MLTLKAMLHPLKKVFNFHDKKTTQAVWKIQKKGGKMIFQDEEN
jgi:hypothetical protein